MRHQRCNTKEQKERNENVVADQRCDTKEQKEDRDGIRREFGVEKITFKTRQATLRWYGHILLMNDGNKV